MYKNIQLLINIYKWVIGLFRKLNKIKKFKELCLLETCNKVSKSFDYFKLKNYVKPKHNL